jgi:hypothetical protein
MLMKGTRTSLLILTTAVFLAGAPPLRAPANAGVDAGALCKDKKGRASGTFHLNLMKAFGKHNKTPNFALLTSDISKAQSKLTKAFTKAEFNGMGVSNGCDTIEDAAALQATEFGQTFRALDQLSGVRFADNGDGTVTDTQTGLMWELKDSGETDGGIHNKDNEYTWTSTDGGSAPDGTAFTVFLATLNDCRVPNGPPPYTITGGFAGYCDWRLPTVNELLGILSPPCSHPSICSEMPGEFPDYSPSSVLYISSTTQLNSADVAFGVYFTAGSTDNVVKDGDFVVRAVRGGW